LRLSTPITALPACNSRRVTCMPMKPAAPVTRIGLCDIYLLASLSCGQNYRAQQSNRRISFAGRGRRTPVLSDCMLRVPLLLTITAAAIIGNLPVEMRLPERRRKASVLLHARSDPLAAISTSRICLSMSRQVIREGGGWQLLKENEEQPHAKYLFCMAERVQLCENDKGNVSPAK
jgi:hypothetical protein